MGDSSIDNVEGLAAELNEALSVLDTTLDIPSFDPHLSPSTSTTPQPVETSAAAASRGSHSRDTSAGSDITISRAPSKHPISCMQGAFQESIADSMEPPSPRKLAAKLDVEARRRQLLELDEVDEGYSSRWQHKPDSKYHPLWKLIAQISFGVHLLNKSLAKSEEEVVKTLQEHVDEVDSFVEDSLADFALATMDIDGRLQALMLPLEHSRTFNRMLCDRTFRQSILDGNEIIERIVRRTAAAMRRSLRDVSEGQDATRELAKFLERLAPEWSKQDAERVAIFNAMKSNARGWMICFGDLQGKAEHLTKLMGRLTYIVDEVAKRCGIASRRKTPAATVDRKSSHSMPRPGSPSQSSANSRSSTQADKPLPPPPMRQKNPASPMQSPRFQNQTPGRPPLLSISSAQTIDCTRPFPPTVDTRSVRPSTGNSSHQSNGSSPPDAEASRATLRNIRAVSHQTGIDQIARRDAAGRLVGPSFPQAPRPASPLQVGPSLRESQSQQSLRSTPTQTTKPASPTVTRYPVSPREPYRIRASQTPPMSPKVTGLGISGSQLRPQRSTSSIKEQATLVAPSTVSLPTPTLSHTPSTPVDEPAFQTVGLGPSKLSLGTFSVFPSTLDPRFGSLSNEEDLLSAKATPRMSTDSRASDKIVVEPPAAKTKSTPSSAVDSAYQSSSETPSLYSSQSLPQIGTRTAPITVPFTPDDITPYGALRSHPITASMYFPPPAAPLTALPPVRSDDRMDHDLLYPETNKKPSVMKKPSMASVKTLFGKKPPKKEVYLGSGGLGGFVNAT